jgi:hypothetical protein
LRARYVLLLFFGTYLVFAGVRRLTDDQPALVTLGAQLVALAVIVGVLVLWVRRRG